MARPVRLYSSYNRCNISRLIIFWTADDPESVIVTAAKRLDARHFPLSQVGIQFVQIGDDAAATEFLTELDDNLASTHGIRVNYSAFYIYALHFLTLFLVKGHGGHYPLHP